MAKGTLYIVPVHIAEDSIDRVIPAYNHQIVGRLRVFAVERLKTARQFLRKIDPTFPIDDCQFFEQNKHQDYLIDPQLFELLDKGQDVGLMSESGYAAVADPGFKVVSKAQQHGVKVVPLVGPTSLLLALAGSGLNGQSFAFNGYLPVKDPERSKQLKFFSTLAKNNNQSQIFIETPYRNQAFVDTVLKVCHPSMKLCIAYDVTGKSEKIITKSVEKWRKSPFKFDKTPCVFILGN